MNPLIAHLTQPASLQKIDDLLVFARFVNDSRAIEAMAELRDALADLIEKRTLHDRGAEDLKQLRQVVDDKEKSAREERLELHRLTKEAANAQAATKVALRDAAADRAKAHFELEDARRTSDRLEREIAARTESVTGSEQRVARMEESASLSQKEGERKKAEYEALFAEALQRGFTIEQLSRIA